MTLSDKPWFMKNGLKRWNPSKRESFSPFFLHQLAEVERVYQMRPVSHGISESDYLRDIRVEGRTFFAMLKRLEWNHQNRDEQHIDVYFKFELAIFVHAHDLPVDCQPTSDGAEIVELMSLPFVMTFPVGYPRYRPTVCPDYNISPMWQIREKYGYLSWMYDHGLCLMNDSNMDWRPEVRSMLTMFDYTIDWMVSNMLNLHYGKRIEY